MKFTQNFIENLKPKEPIPTGLEPELSHTADIRAVIFDIYGTLLISESGDIEEAEMVSRNILKTLDSVGIGLEADKPEDVAGLILTAFSREIKRQQKVRLGAGFKFPEIDIISVWSNVLSSFAEYGHLPWPVPISTISEIAIIFELLSNPVFPMPGMQKIIAKLKEQNIPLGIVSNAQFYTPICMNYFLTGTLNESEEIEYFDPELTIYSYQHQIGKPSTVLYQLLIEPLRDRYQLKPKDVLFVGNDMKKDIMAAKTVGFKTALFAGDMRSLRLRRDKPDINKYKPDYVLTELEQILELL